MEFFQSVCVHCATENVDSMHAHRHREQSSLGWEEAFLEWAGYSREHAS